jgi:hypothetical protein
MKKIKYLKLTEILGLGVEQFGVIEFDLDKNINILAGKNSEGKSRVIRAIKELLSDRLDLNWLKTDGSKTGEIECYFDDGTKIQINIGTNAKRKIIDPDGLPVHKDVLLESLRKLLYDPADFLEPKNWQNRIRFAVEALGLDLNEASWTAEIGAEYVPVIDYSLNAIDQIEAVKKHFETFRRDHKRSRDEHKKTIETLKRTIPDKVDKNFDKELSSIESLIEATVAEREIAKKRVSDEAAAETAKIKDEIHELELKISALKNKTNQIDARSNERVVRIDMDSSARLSDLRAQKEQIKEDIEAISKAKVTRELIADTETKLEEQLEKVDIYENLLLKLSDWKNRLVADSPIPGLSVSGKDLEYQGVPWASLNTASQIKIFIEVSKEIIKTLPENARIPLILCDRIESLDNEARKYLAESIVQNDLQVVFCDVLPDADNGLKLLNYFPTKTCTNV